MPKFQVNKGNKFTAIQKLRAHIMIIKHADDHAGDIDTLETLLDHPDASAADRTRITSEIRRVKAGARGEKSAAYEIDRLFAASDDHAVIHDLRIEVDGQTAQIDHLVFNRYMQAFLCETKNFAEGLSCNELGEWVGFRNNRPFGVASPLHQGDRHRDILQTLLKKEHVWHPRRLGSLINVRMSHFVLVSNSARITRPKAGSVPDIDRVVKIEGFGERRKEYATKAGLLGSIMKMVSADVLTTFAKGLADCHVPAAPDWQGKFGLIPMVGKSPTIVSQVPVFDAMPATPSATNEPAEKKRLICTACGISVAFVVARFCWRNTARFGGKAYCRECQTGV